MDVDGKASKKRKSRNEGLELHVVLWFACGWLAARRLATASADAEPFWPSSKC